MFFKDIAQKSKSYRVKFSSVTIKTFSSGENCQIPVDQHYLFFLEVSV